MGICLVDGSDRSEGDRVGKRKGDDKQTRLGRKAESSRLTSDAQDYYHNYSNADGSDGQYYYGQRKSIGRGKWVQTVEDPVTKVTWKEYGYYNDYDTSDIRF